MTASLRFGLLALALLVAGSAAAQTSGMTDVDADGLAAGGEYGAYDDYYDADLAAATDDAAGALDADASRSGVDDAKAGDFWSWLALSFSAMIGNLAAALGADAPEVATDADAEVFVSDDGVDLDATVTGVPCPPATPDAPVALPDTPDVPVDAPSIPCGTVDYDASEAGGADGKTWETMSTLRSKLPS